MENFIAELINTQFVRNLNSLKVMMKKAEETAKKNNFEVDKFLDVKLAPNMFNLTKQIQVTTDIAKGVAARLSLGENPSFPDTEKTWPELVARIDKTISYLTKFKAADFTKYQEAKVTFHWNPEHELHGHDYLISFALPNFYFHLTTAYDLLRSNGVPLGKGDYLGEINWKHK